MGARRGLSWHPMKPAALLLAAVPLACAAPPPATTPPSTAAASTAPAAAPASPPIAPSAKILGAAALESGPDLKVKILFENLSPWSCRFVSYKVSWASSSKEIKLDGVTIPAGQTRERSIKLHAND